MSKYDILKENMALEPLDSFSQYLKLEKLQKQKLSSVSLSTLQIHPRIIKVDIQFLRPTKFRMDQPFIIQAKLDVVSYLLSVMVTSIYTIKITKCGRSSQTSSKQSSPRKKN